MSEVRSTVALLLRGKQHRRCDLHVLFTLELLQVESATDLCLNSRIETDHIEHSTPSARSDAPWHAFHGATSCKRGLRSEAGRAFGKVLLLLPLLLVLLLVAVLLVLVLVLVLGVAAVVGVIVVLSLLARSPCKRAKATCRCHWYLSIVYVLVVFVVPLIVVVAAAVSVAAVAAGASVVVVVAVVVVVGGGGGGSCVCRRAGWSDVGAGMC